MSSKTFEKLEHGDKVVVYYHTHPKAAGEHVDAQWKPARRFPMVTSALVTSIDVQNGKLHGYMPNGRGVMNAVTFDLFGIDLDSEFELV